MLKRPEVKGGFGISRQTIPRHSEAYSDSNMHSDSTNTVNSYRHPIAFSLLFMRLGVAIVFLMWTLDKFVNPDHASKVFERFYMIPSLSANSAGIIGGIQLAIVIAFVVGWLRTWSYGIVLAMHAVSTFSSYAKYLDPWTYPNLLFFAAIPMLGACLALWMLRKLDIYSVDGLLQLKREREHQRMERVVDKLDSILTHGQTVAA